MYNNIIPLRYKVTIRQQASESSHHHCGNIDSRRHLLSGGKGTGWGHMQGQRQRWTRGLLHMGPELERETLCNILMTCKSVGGPKVAVFQAPIFLLPALMFIWAGFPRLLEDEQKGSKKGPPLQDCFKDEGLLGRNESDRSSPVSAEADCTL